MRIIYTTTPNITSRADNIVDLEAYRRKLLPDQEGSLAPQPRIVDLFPLEGEEEPLILRETPPRRSRRSLGAGLLLDALASAGMLVMTLTFTLRVLMV